MLNIKYTASIKKPYKMALETPALLLSPLFLVKKLTVSGIIGNTQGVNNANKPPKKPNPKILQSVFSSLVSEGEMAASSLQFWLVLLRSMSDSPYRKGLTDALSATAFVVSSAKGFPLKLNTKSAFGGNTHCMSLQAINSTEALMIGKSSGVTETRCLKTVEFSKYLISISKTASSTVVPSSSTVSPKS